MFVSEAPIENPVDQNNNGEKKPFPNLEECIDEACNNLKAMLMSNLKTEDDYLTWKKIRSQFLRLIEPTIMAMKKNPLALNQWMKPEKIISGKIMKQTCLLYTSPSPRDRTRSRMPSSA